MLNKNMNLIAKFKEGYSASSYYNLGFPLEADAKNKLVPFESYILYNGKLRKYLLDGEFVFTAWVTKVTFSHRCRYTYNFSQGDFFKTELEKLKIRTAIELTVLEEIRSKYILILKL